MLAFHTHFALVEMSYEAMAVKNEEQDIGILILYSLRSSCVSNIFSALIGISAVKTDASFQDGTASLSVVSKRELTYLTR